MTALLFVDVDGTLLPIGGPACRAYDGPNPLLARLDPGHGARLAALPCDLVWATAWMTDANEAIAPVLGLPDLPVVEWPESDEDGIGAVHWKTRHLVDWAAGRPFVWVDDEIGTADREWVAVHHPGPALLHRVDGRVGLTETDYAAICEWLARL